MSNDRETTTKQYNAYVIVDWRDEALRLRKTAPSEKIGPTELAIPLEVNVEVPDVQVPTIEAAIEVPPAEVREAVVEDTKELAREKGVLDEDGDAP